MKAKREHRVPLTDRGLAILGEAQPPGGGYAGLVFPSPSGKSLSDMTHRKLLMTLGIDCVPHGFRSSFRDWAAEQTDAPHGGHGSGFSACCGKLHRGRLFSLGPVREAAGSDGAVGRVSGR